MSANHVEIIKERLPIVEVVSPYVKLTKAGKNFKGLSPFKKEKTASFYVSPERNAYYCFSTGKGGDAFTFIQEMEGVDFRGALAILAERAGVALVEQTKEVKDERDRSFTIMNAAIDFYHQQLLGSAQAQEYLASRKVTTETIAAFCIGYAPDSWEAARAHLKKLDYTDNELERVGIIKRGESGKYYDRFRSRIMFPIRDPSGRGIGFSGRIIGAQAANPENAKYINSPESALYDKSSALFGFDRAKASIRTHDFSILVEGQMDLIMAHQSGWKNSVAVSGTSFTKQHLTLLSRVSKNIVLALDADSAGIASTHKTALMALSEGMEVKIAVLPEGSDPAELLAKDTEAWRMAIKGAQTAVTFFLNRALFGNTDSRRVQKHVVETVLPLIITVDKAIDKAYFVRQVAEALRIPPEAIWTDMARMGEGAHPDTQFENTVTPVQSAVRSRKETLLRALAGIAQTQTPHLPIKEAPHFQTVIEMMGDEGIEILDSLEPQKERLLFEAELLLEGGSREVDSVVQELVQYLTAEVLKEHYERASRELVAAERAGDEGAVAIALSGCYSIAQKIAALTASSK